MNGDTATRLIETAERLFAERGVHGVSLREIGAEAGQRNTGAVRYHFGSKEQLLDAVFEHRMVSINAHRLALLDELDRCGRGHELRGLAEAFLYPLAQMLGEPGRPSWYLRFCIHAAYVEGTAPHDLEGQDWTRGVAIIAARYQQLLRGCRRSRAAAPGALVAAVRPHDTCAGRPGASRTALAAARQHPAHRVPGRRAGHRRSARRSPRFRADVP